MRKVIWIFYLFKKCVRLQFVSLVEQFNLNLRKKLHMLVMLLTFKNSQQCCQEP